MTILGVSFIMIAVFVEFGLLTLKDAWSNEDEADDESDLADRVQSIHIPLMVTLRGDVRVSGTITYASGGRRRD